MNQEVNADTIPFANLQIQFLFHQIAADVFYSNNQPMISRLRSAVLSLQLFLHLE